MAYPFQPFKNERALKKTVDPESHKKIRAAKLQATEPTIPPDKASIKTVTR